MLVDQPYHHDVGGRLSESRNHQAKDQDPRQLYLQQDGEEEQDIGQSCNAHGGQVARQHFLNGVKHQEQEAQANDDVGGCGDNAHEGVVNVVEALKMELDVGQAHPHDVNCHVAGEGDHEGSQPHVILINHKSPTDGFQTD